MEESLKGKVAIVTGASRGIGRKIALKLGKLGASVVVNYAKNDELAKEVVSEIMKMGGQATHIRADMKNIDEIVSLYDSTIEKFNAVNILVNNAAIDLYKKVEEVTEEEFDSIFSCNIKGLFFACQQAAKKMANGGKIINISSSVTKLMIPTYGPYAATKGAVEQLTKVLAKELGHKGIAVNSLSPGPTDTDMFRRGHTNEQYIELGRMAALGRIGTPDDIANAVALLVSEEAGWITGQNIGVNGGLVA